MGSLGSKKKNYQTSKRRQEPKLEEQRRKLKKSLNVTTSKVRQMKGIGLILQKGTGTLKG